MNRSTRSLLRASALAPVAVTVAVAAMPAQANEGPVASLVKGAVNQSAPLPAADLNSPKLQLPSVSDDRVFSAGRSRAVVRRTKDGSQEALTQLGKGLVNTGGLDMAFAGISSRCISDADGTVRAVTKVAGGRLTGGKVPAMPKIPVSPPANFGVPTGDPNMILVLNKQVRDPWGGMTVSGVSLDSTPGTGGVTREFGVAHCDPIRKMATKHIDKFSKMAAAKRRASGDPVSMLLGTVTGATKAVPLVGGLGNPLAGGLPTPGRLGTADRVPVPPSTGSVDLPQGGLGGLPGLSNGLPTGAVPALPPLPTGPNAIGLPGQG